VSDAAAGPVRVGLIGAGPWAEMTHAPMLAGGPETELVAVWARRPEPAQALAAAHGARACASVEELVDSCEAVAFAVPPDIQASLAPAAARAGKHLLLEKPIALDLPAAERIAAAVAEAGVGSMVFLTSRFAAETRAFLAEAASVSALGGRACFITGSAIGGPYAASPWRQERGALYDLGPHAIDLIDAAVGPVVPGSVRAHGRSTNWIGLLLEHVGGAFTEVSLSMATTADECAQVSVYTAERRLELAYWDDHRPTTLATIRREFAEVARGASHPCDVQRGLHLQRILAEADAALSIA
jgi:predicted dehydrogenase